MGRLENAVLSLAVGLGSVACDSGPKVKTGVELTNPVLNLRLACERETFHEILEHNPLSPNTWARENCPGFEDRVSALAETDKPLETVKAVHTKILEEAEVDPKIETLSAEMGQHYRELVVRTNDAAVRKAQRQGRVKK